MLRKLIIFGAGQIAELAHFYFTHDSAYEVAAFTVDAAYMKEKEFSGLPVIPFEELTETYPPTHFSLFIALSYNKLNKTRAEKLTQARQLGYPIASYLSSKASVFEGFELRENCFILEDNTIQPFAVVGENVTLWSGNHIGHHSVIENDVFIASHVIVSGGVRIGAGSFVGVNATLRDHVTVGAKCVLGAGALVLEDLPDFSVVAPRGTERSAVPSTRLRNL
jgi:sugar O-acyltransferase (sialic acid O-acetyltransferase NeuD family)